MPAVVDPVLDAVPSAGLDREEFLESSYGFGHARPRHTHVLGRALGPAACEAACDRVRERVSASTKSDSTPKRSRTRSTRSGSNSLSCRRTVRSPKLAELRRGRAPRRQNLEAAVAAASQTRSTRVVQPARRGAQGRPPHGAERLDRLLPRSRPRPRRRLSRRRSRHESQVGRQRFGRLSVCLYSDVWPRRPPASGKETASSCSPTRRAARRNSSAPSGRASTSPTPCPVPDDHDHERHRRGGKVDDRRESRRRARARRTSGHPHRRRAQQSAPPPTLQPR